MNSFSCLIRHCGIKISEEKPLLPEKWDSLKSQKFIRFSQHTHHVTATLFCSYDAHSSATSIFANVYFLSWNFPVASNTTRGPISTGFLLRLSVCLCDTTDVSLFCGTCEEKNKDNEKNLREQSTICDKWSVKYLYVEYMRLGVMVFGHYIFHSASLRHPFAFFTIW